MHWLGEGGGGGAVEGGQLRPRRLSPSLLPILINAWRSLVAPGSYPLPPTGTPDWVRFDAAAAMATVLSLDDECDRRASTLFCQEAQRP